MKKQDIYVLMQEMGGAMSLIVQLGNIQIMWGQKQMILIARIGITISSHLRKNHE